MIFLDLETTGFDPKENKIIEFAAVRTNEKFEVLETLDFLVNPEAEIPLVVQQITNITDEQVMNEPTFDTRVEEVKAFIKNDVIVGHNIQFDISFLQEWGICLENKSLDTNDFATLCLPTQESYALEVLSDVFGIEHQYKHRALGDVLACVDLMKICSAELQKFPESFFERVEQFRSKMSGEIVKELQNMALPLSPPDKGDLGGFNQKAITKPHSLPLSGEQTAALQNQVETFLQASSLEQAENLLLQHLKNGGILALNSHFLQFFQVKFQKELQGIPLIIAPEKSISQKSLEVFFAKESFDQVESLVVLKILRNIAQKRALTEFDLNIHWGDYLIWSKYLQASLEEVQDELQEIVNTSQSCVVASSLILKNEITIPENKKTLFFDLKESDLDRVFTGVFAQNWIEKRIDCDELQNEVQSFFETFKSLVVEPDEDLGKYGKQEILEEKHFQSDIFTTLKKEAEVLIESFSKIASLKNSADVLEQFFKEDDNFVKFVYVNKRAEITLNVGAIQFKSILKNLSQNTQFLNFDSAIADDTSFYKTVLGKEGGLKTFPKIAPVLRTPDDNFPMPKSDNFIQAARDEIEAICKNSEEAVIVYVPTKKALEDLYNSFIGKPCDEERKLIATGFTGGKFKTLHVLNHNKKALVLCNDDFVEFFAVHEKCFNKAVILQFPFDAPTPVLKKRSDYFVQELKNTEFGAYALPKSVLKVQRVIALLNAKELYFLDTRVKNSWAKDYLKIVT